MCTLSPKQAQMIFHSCTLSPSSEHGTYFKLEPPYCPGVFVRGRRGYKEILLREKWIWKTNPKNKLASNFIPSYASSFYPLSKTPNINDNLVYYVTGRDSRLCISSSLCCLLSALELATAWKAGRVSWFVEGCNNKCRPSYCFQTVIK